VDLDTCGGSRRRLWECQLIAVVCGIASLRLGPT
jgi:hypothetical protein